MSKQKQMFAYCMYIATTMIEINSNQNMRGSTLCDVCVTVIVMSVHLNSIVVSCE